jgi:hypothetical protein
MMNEFTSRIGQYAIAVGQPMPTEEFSALPFSYMDVLRLANGFITRNGWFRFFGTRSVLSGIPSVGEWNNSAWKREYGSVFNGFYIIAEDIFGDQYGFWLNERTDARPCKIFCEGAIAQFLDFSDTMEFLLKSVLVDQPTAFDSVLADSAWKNGIRAGVGEHLAFSLPLILGGEYSIFNLGVESTALHLGLLGQLTLKNSILSDATSISRFSVNERFETGQ